MRLPAIKAVGNGVIWFASAALFISSAILVRSRNWYQPGSDFGYNLGLVGGILMLLLLIYPLKKRFKPLQRMGSTKPWFIFHMVCGVGGPLAVIYHSTFRINSQNAFVAMMSMLLVAGSGIVGRFIYVRIHAGLSGQELTLDELESSETVEALNFERDMHWAPEVIARLRDFRAWAGRRAKNSMSGIVKFLYLPIMEWQVRRNCHMLLSVQLKRRAEARNWDARKRLKRAQQFDALVASYTFNVKRHAQFEVYKRMFSWWHILHLPFVYLLAASAAYHVLAVHMY